MILCLSLLEILICHTIEACGSWDPSRQNFMNTQGYSEFNPAIGRGNMSGIGRKRVGFDEMGDGAGASYEGFSSPVGMVNPVGNLGIASPLAGTSFGSNVFGSYDNLRKSDVYDSKYPIGVGSQTPEVGFGSAGNANYNVFGRGSSYGSRYPTYTGSYTPQVGKPSYVIGYGADGGGGCPPSEIITQMLDRGNEQAVAQLLQRCGNFYHTSKPVLSKLAKFKGLLNNLLGGGKCSNISPEYLEVIANEGGEEVIEVFKEHCPSSIFDDIKNKLERKLRPIEGEIKQEARELKQDVSLGVKAFKEEIKRGIQKLAVKFEDLRTMDHFKLFGAHITNVHHLHLNKFIVQLTNFSE
jgi:hypothetical protein